ncbi:MAG: glucose-6-phosphate dehydrogenase [Vulcanimicrobiaceae bacterium]
MPDAVVTQAYDAGNRPAAVNPLRSGLTTGRISDACNIVFFGASGDLFKRMLLPAIWELHRGGILPAQTGIIGFARTAFDNAGFRDYCHEQLTAFSTSGPPDDELWKTLAERISYITADFTDPAHFTQLKDLLDARDKKSSKGGNRLFYLATPPPVFPQIIRQLQTAKLDPHSNKKGWTRVVIEKPFGTDLASARALQREVEQVFDESRVYRIDHYLGKEPVQDIMALRFANTIFEPVWNRNYVDSVQITAAETLGVEERGGYYDGAGALRDMIQNHVMNLLALVAMEPPSSNDADAIRTEKYKVFAAIRQPKLEDVAQIAVRGQYGKGTVDGKPAKEYREEDDVRPDSNTETFAAVKFEIENWRWASVPFYLRSGKRLARKRSEIAVTFKSVPHRLYGESTDTIEPNVLVLKIQPDEGISMRFEAKVPGSKQHIRSVFMDFNYGTGFRIESPPAYERLIGDAMRGDQTLFTRWDAVERAWELVTPILETWLAERDSSFPNYLPGGQGPATADKLFSGWRPL